MSTNGQLWVVFCLEQHMKALCGMLMKSLVILGSNKHIIFSRHNIGGEGCNYKFNLVCLLMCGV